MNRQIGSNANQGGERLEHEARWLASRQNPLGDGLNRKMRRLAKKKFGKEIEPGTREPIEPLKR